jgi:hypothetical protein
MYILQSRLVALISTSFYYIVKEFLNVDQVLLTSITRSALHFHIKGVFANGFGSENEWLVSATDRVLRP